MIHIFAWPVEEAVSPKSFTTFKLSQYWVRLVMKNNNQSKRSLP